MLFFDYRESEEKFFEENDLSNFDIKFYRENLDENFLENLSEKDFEDTMIISVFITSNLDKNVISKFKNLRIISTRSTGFDHIDVKFCAEKNISLIHVDTYGNSAVSQFAFCLILMLVRNIFQALTMKDATSEMLCGRDMKTLTLGVVGTGAIGMAVCSYARCFGMKVVAYDILEKQDLVNNYDVCYLPFEDLLKTSDIVALFLPYTNENYHMFSYEQFEMMKQDSFFVNVSRGEVVDTEALLHYAKESKFKGLGLDVVACKCNNASDKEKSSVSCLEMSQSVKELSTLPNVIITPHMAYNTHEAIDYILRATFDGISDTLSGGRKYRVV